MSVGYVYVLKNPSLQDDYLEIGGTEEDPKVRARQLSSATGLARPYRVVFSTTVPDCERAERLVHRALDSSRIDADREFFRVPVEKAQSVASSVAERVRSESILCGNCRTWQERRELEKECLRLERELATRTGQVAELEKRLSRLADGRRRERRKNIRLIARRFAVFIARLVTSPFVQLEQFLSRFISDETERLVCAVGIVLLGGLGLLVLFLAFAPAGAGIALTLLLLSIAALLVMTSEQRSDS